MNMAASLADTTVRPSDWQRTLADAIATGARAVSLHATQHDVRVLIAGPEGEHLFRCPVVDSAAPSLIGVAPSLEWGEREAHDLVGIRFDGHSPLRPLVTHDLDLAAWSTPVHGHGTSQVAVGPIHAGVIESGHFRFHVVGERILHLDVRLFYKHRGLERAAGGMGLTEALPVVQRMCAACAVTNTVAYAHAAEHALGLWPAPDLARARTILLELERIYNHLHDIGQLCAGVGFAPGTMTFLALKERAQRLNQRLTGHRFLFDTVAIGETPFRVDAGTAQAARVELGAIARAAREGWHEVLFNGSVQDRLDDVGIVTREWAKRLGAVGPAARASGVTRDARSESPRLSYAGFTAAAPERGPTGDVKARLDMRAVELWAAFAFLDELLATPLTGGVAVAAHDPAVFGASRVESPRGETACVLERDDGRVGRLHIRTGSNANWRVVAHAAADNLLPDFPLINKSFELCYSCSDR